MTDILKSFRRGWAWCLLFVLLLAGLYAGVAIYKKRLPGLGFLRRDKLELPGVSPRVSGSGEGYRLRTEPFVPPIGSDATNVSPAAGPFVPQLAPGATNVAPTAGPFVPAMGSGSTNTDQKSAPFVPRIAATIAGPDGRPVEPPQASAFVPRIGAGGTNAVIQAAPVVPAITPAPAASAACKHCSAYCGLAL